MIESALEPSNMEPSPTWEQERGQVAPDWFESMYEDLAATAVRFTAVDVVTPDPVFGECKWLMESLTRLSDLSALQATVASLPETRWRNKPSYILFMVGGLSPELHKLAAGPAERLHLVQGADLLSD